MSGNSGKRKQETDDISVPICSHTHVGVIKVLFIKSCCGLFFETKSEILSGWGPETLAETICSHTHVGVIKVLLIKVMRWVAAFFEIQPEISSKGTTTYERP